MNEGGLIDTILDFILKEDGEEETPVGQALSELIDDGFKESWAGQVVQSWTDSIQGFSNFRVPALKLI